MLQLRKLSLMALFFMSLPLCGQQQKVFSIPSFWGDWQTWGQQEDGTYINPVLPADFSDIDCIEHDGFYYAISSTFQFEPGMVILRSADMVNWSVAGHAVPDISQISEDMEWSRMNRYARGIWAGAIRWHNGRFFVYFGCPDEGMFMTSSVNAEGPWEPLTKMNIDGGWDDCCPLFDDDGRNYFVATHYADGYKTYIFPLMEDCRTVDRQGRVLINEGYGREANKLYKWNGKYYHLFSQNKDGGRYLMMQRADNPMGPYTEQQRLSLTQREWNEPNQGGFLQDQAGEWYFLTHHGTGDWGGREASLLPVVWSKEGWPVIGAPNPDGIGTMVLKGTMPESVRDLPQDETIYGKDGTEGFAAEEWEWNHHPRQDCYIRTRNELTLKAFRPLQEDNLLKAGNTLTLRSMQVPYNEVKVCLDISNMAEGERAGICHFSASWSEFGVLKNGGDCCLYHRTDKGEEKVILSHLTSKIYLSSTWGLDARCSYSYCVDGQGWTSCGPLYQLQWGHYRGDRVGLFNYNNIADEGEVTFTDFEYKSGDGCEYNDATGR